MCFWVKLLVADNHFLFLIYVYLVNDPVKCGATVSCLSIRSPIMLSDNATLFCGDIVPFLILCPIMSCNQAS
jgi:hypothetical protein